jgi:hypothetical protein
MLATEADYIDESTADYIDKLKDYDMCSNDIDYYSNTDNNRNSHHLPAAEFMHITIHNYNHNHDYNFHIHNSTTGTHIHIHNIYHDSDLPPNSRHDDHCNFHIHSGRSQPQSNPLQVLYGTPLLPAGWEQMVDPTSGRRYYHNWGTRESSWKPPAGTPELSVYVYIEFDTNERIIPSEEFCVRLKRTSAIKGSHRPTLETICQK